MKKDKRTSVGVAIATVVAFAAVVHCWKKHRTAARPSGKDNLLTNNLPKELCIPLDTPGVFLGETTGTPDMNKYVGKSLHSDGHLLVVGSSGSGKTTSIVYPTMETASGFGIYLDIKGDAAAQLRRANNEIGKKCLVLNPYDLSQSTCWYDPFSALRHDPEHLADHAYQLAKMLVPASPLDHNQVWTEAAGSYVAGGIIYYYNQGLSFLDALKEINLRPIDEVLDTVMHSEDGIAKVFLSKYAAMEEKVIAGIGMELTNHLAPFTTSVAICNACTPSEGKVLLDWNQLNSEWEPFDVVLVFPEDKLTAERPLLCAIINQLIETLERRPMRSYNRRIERPPVLLMLDEFPRLGRIPALKDGLTTLRSRGVTMVLLLQSFASLDEVYGADSARVIIENCTYKAILGSTDVESQHYLSALAGSAEVLHESTSFSVALPAHSFGVGKSYSQERRPLIYSHVFSNLKDEIVLIAPQGAFRIKKRSVFPGESIVAQNRLCAAIRRNNHDLPGASNKSKRRFPPSRATTPPGRGTPQKGRGKA